MLFSAIAADTFDLRRRAQRPAHLASGAQRIERVAGRLIDRAVGGHGGIAVADRRQPARPHQTWGGEPASEPVAGDGASGVGHDEHVSDGIDHRGQRIAGCAHRPPQTAAALETEYAVVRSGPDHLTATEQKRRRREIAAVLGAAVKAPELASRAHVDRVQHAAVRGRVRDARRADHTGPGTTGPSSRRCQRTWTEVGPATIAAP
jgi:hypothetical protein